MSTQAQDERTLAEVTEDLGFFYAKWKTYEKSKNTEKDAFFKLATTASAAHVTEFLATTPGMLGVAMTEAKATALLEKYNPRFRVDELRVTPKGYEAIMAERPEFMPFSYVNLDDGNVYTRQVVDGPQTLDDDLLADTNPGLYTKVTFELPWGERVVRPFDTLDPDDLSAIAPYVYRGKPTVKLAAPRPATEEELASVAG